MARLHFTDGEVAGLMLVTPETAWDLLAQESVASGMRYSLPRYLDWLEKQGIGDRWRRKKPRSH